MNRFRRAVGARSAVIAGAFVLAFFAVPAAGAATCSQQVLDDWSDNGRVDRVYELRCYDEAIAALPADLRDYTDAAEVIQRAQSDAVRTSQASGEFTEPELAAAGASDSSGASSVPVAALVGGAAALAIVLAGAVAYVARRRGSP
jgi:hypothetical protein